MIIDKSAPPQEDGDASVDAGGAIGAGSAGEDTNIIIKKFESPHEDGDAYVDLGGEASCAGGAIGASEDTEMIIENSKPPQEDGDASVDAGGDGSYVAGASGAEYVRHNDAMVSQQREDGGGAGGLAGACGCLYASERADGDGVYSDSFRTPSSPHYSCGGGRATFVLPKSAPSRELETSSYYEDEQILCWCVRCRGTYRRPRHQCHSHESEYGAFVDAPAPSQRHRPMVPAYDMENDVRLSSHGTSRMPNEYMRLLHKSDPKSYDKLKKQYEMDFGQPHGNYNEDNDMDANDIDKSINDWYEEDDVGDDESFLRAEALQRIYKGSKLPQLIASLLVLNLQDPYAWSNASVLALFKLLSQKLLPPTNVFPTSRGYAKKMISKLGLDYNMIHACPNDCILYRVHLLIHLVDEIEIVGVVRTCWMFWVERFMGVLKGLVCQRARPEGSMSEGWVLGECMYYLAKHLERVDEDAPHRWTLDEPTTLSDEPLRITREPYILPAHYEQAFLYAALDSNSPRRQVVPINPRERRIFDTTYVEADQDSLHEDDPTSTEPLPLTTLAQEEPQEEAGDDNDAANDETEDLAMEIEFEPHLLPQPSIALSPTLPLDIHLTAEELQETIQDNEEIELIIDHFPDHD
ncbi:hypothetical protein L7F22_041752 [Adiantum nelumboides]|nr:hypothetical protein [Adiantum nelumboides]